MAQTGYTPISIYYSSTATNVPTAGNLVAGELAINTADGKLFYKDSAGVVQTIATKTAAGITAIPVTVPQGGTGTTLLTQGYLIFGQGTSSVGTNSNLFWDNTNSRLGISTTSPVVGLDTRTGLNVFTTDSNTTKLGFMRSTLYNGNLVTGAIHTVAATVGYSDGGGLAFATSLGNNAGTAGLTDRMYIDDAGNVGIGTSSPAANLHVSGTLPYVNLAYPGYSTLQLGSGIASGTAGGVIATDAGPIVFKTGTTYTASPALNGTERMRIDTSGNLLVGKTAISDTTVGAYLKPDGTTCSSTAGTNSMNFYNTSAGAYRFYVTAAGQVNATSTSINAISDISLKENIKDLETGLTEVMALKPRRFDWKEETKIGEKNVAGFIAQELEEVLPELVYEYQYNESETKKSIKMGDILPTLVKAIQEQQAMIEELKAKVAVLENK
jgi:hypothetical protein